MRSLSILAILSSAAVAHAQPAPPVGPHHHKAPITYKPGRWLVFHAAPKTKLRFRLILEPMLRYGHADNQKDDTIDMFIRRGRIGFDAELPHGLGFRFETSVKNMHFEIHNMFLRWDPQRDLEAQFGFIKAPGGLERDTFSFDQPFIERSTMTFLNYDHEVGAMVEQHLDGDRWRWAASITREPPPLPGGDPEDSPVIPTGVESEDLVREAAKWNAAARVIASPSDAFEASIRGALRFRPDAPDFGQIAVEPYDSTFLTNRPYRGTMATVSADVATSQPHWKAVAEAGVRRDGTQLAYPDGTVGSETSLDGHLVAATGYLVLGYTPNGTYGAAVDAAPLRTGWEVVSRLQFSWVRPVDDPDGIASNGRAATLVMGELGLHWEPIPQLRVQADLAVEKFGPNDVTRHDENHDSLRIWAQTWLVMRL